MPAPVKHVIYNDGNEERFAIIVGDHGDTKLDLVYWNGTSWQATPPGNPAPRREPPYDENGGGHTWREP